jgi:transposase-like protein
VNKQERPADDPRESPECPFCGERDAEVISLFGTQAMTLQYRCRHCRSYFEAIKYAD